MTGQAYRDYTLSTLARMGPLPRSAMPILREAGRLTVELDRLATAKEAALSSKRPRRAEIRRLGAETRKSRVQLLMLERRLEEVAGERNGHTPDELLGRVHREMRQAGQADG
jgi:hypothetical protein